jgi:hypothetical protein
LSAWLAIKQKGKRELPAEQFFLHDHTIVESHFVWVSGGDWPVPFPTWRTSKVDWAEEQPEFAPGWQNHQLSTSVAQDTTPSAGGVVTLPTNMEAKGGRPPCKHTASCLARSQMD